MTAPTEPVAILDKAAVAVGESIDGVTAALDEFVSGARDAIATLQRRVEELEAERDELAEQVKSLQTEQDDDNAELVEALTKVRYWIHDIVVHGRLPDPLRKLLPIVEEALRGNG